MAIEVNKAIKTITELNVNSSYEIIPIENAHTRI